MGKNSTNLVNSIFRSNKNSFNDSFNDEAYIPEFTWTESFYQVPFLGRVELVKSKTNQVANNSTASGDAVKSSPVLKSKPIPTKSPRLSNAAKRSRSSSNSSNVKSNRNSSTSATAADTNTVQDNKAITASKAREALPTISQIEDVTSAHKLTLIPDTVDASLPSTATPAIVESVKTKIAQNVSSTKPADNKEYIKKAYSASSPNSSMFSRITGVNFHATYSSFFPVTSIISSIFSYTTPIKNSKAESKTKSTFRVLRVQKASDMGDGTIIPSTSAGSVSVKKIKKSPKSKSRFDIFSKWNKTTSRKVYKFGTVFLCLFTVMSAVLYLGRRNDMYLFCGDHTTHNL